MQIPDAIIEKAARSIAGIEFASPQAQAEHLLSAVVSDIVAARDQQILVAIEDRIAGGVEGVGLLQAQDAIRVLPGLFGEGEESD